MENAGQKHRPLIEVGKDADKEEEEEDFNFALNKKWNTSVSWSAKAEHFCKQLHTSQLLSRWWKLWAGLCSVFVWLTTSSAELLWPSIQHIVEAPHSQMPPLRYLAGASDGLPAHEYTIVGHDFGNSISPTEGETNMKGFSARTGLASESSDAVEDDRDEAMASGSGRSPEASPRFVSQFYEWYKGKEKQKEKEKEEVKQDNDNYHVIISHHAAQTHHSDHHSSHHDDHHDHGHRPGYGHGHYHHDHDHYHHDHDHYHHDHGHSHGHGHYGYGHHGSHSNIHIHGYPYPPYQGGHSPYPPYPFPYPYYPPPPHHHHQQHPVVQPIIIGAGGGGGGGGGKGKGKGKNKGKLIILNTSSTGGQVSTQGNYAAGYRYIS
ncbi:uncharacterized protein [Palaemon carinicauda]|uniref:uncharacterized protein n=1 Tax=Palaemon carinicauda TaxID=392227 RepID=UPI0035B5AC1E